MGREMHQDWLISLFIVCSREEGKMQAVEAPELYEAPCVQFRELPLAPSSYGNIGLLLVARGAAEQSRCGQQ